MVIYAMRTSTSWFQQSAQQGVFMKAATLRPINRSGPVQTHGKKRKVRNPRERYFVVGKTVVGGDEIVGGEIQ
jgi:hypothetical protein